MPNKPHIPDLFNAIRNRLSIILIKLDRHSKKCNEEPNPEDHENFWTDIYKEFDIVTELVTEKRSSKRLRMGRGPSYVQKIFLWIFALVIVLLSFVVYETTHIHTKHTKQNLENPPIIVQ
jgi:hypothetical protein